MALIKDSSLEAVKAAADIVAVIEGRTSLRKVGGRYTGRCPFHEERTPSFSVNPVEKLYFCFGCGAKGDLISFVIATEQVDFVGAIEWLAERFNVPLEYEDASPEQDARRRRRKRLHALLDEAAAFYERYLWEANAAAFAREYLSGRGFGEDVCRLYRLGYAHGGRELARRALGKGYTAEELAAAGLANRRGNDYFSRRLLFPLAEAQGQVVGFQARRLFEDDPLQAKYVNSPEGDLFRKGNLLYGLDKARAAATKQDRVVVVEGNPDVLALRQTGFEPVVASMGTALTESQLGALKRLTRRLYLCFDADAAGQAATLRGMELAAAKGFEIRVVSLPPGKDPDDVADSFEHYLGAAEPYLLYRVRLELDGAADRQEAFVRAREVLARFEDSPERQDALRLVADRLDLPRETQSGFAPLGTTRASQAPMSAKLLDAGSRRERDLLAAAVAHPEIAAHLADLAPDHFDDELNRRMRDVLLGDAEPDEELTALHAELDARGAREGITLEAGKELLLRLRERKLRRELANADPQRTLELQEALIRIREAVGGLA
jgi:DNA primase